ncbi:MAG: hypothetical protein JSW27_22190 [Phycisphaerales bacterium]|nr:MAG: hypothetical protein JSW27_22190 [Phycisphaerales bacterium]
MGEPSNAEHEEKGRRKPPRSLTRIAGEVLVGTVTATALAFLSALVVGYGAESAFPGLGESCMGGLLVFAVLAMMIIAALPVYIVGCAIGVYLVGRIGSQTGSFLAAFGGVFLGAPVIALLYLYIDMAGDMMLGIVRIALWALVLLTPAIMSTLCFNLTRRYKTPPSS